MIVLFLTLIAFILMSAVLFHLIISASVPDRNIIFVWAVVPGISVVALAEDCLRFSFSVPLLQGDFK